MSDPAAENMFKVRGKYQDGEFSQSKSKKIAVSMIVSSILAQCSILHTVKMSEKPMVL